VVGSCEHWSGISFPEFLDYLRDFEGYKKDSASWSFA
jgi:hypothetical protein